MQDSLDKKKERRGGHFWAGVLTGALIMALAVLLVVGVSAGIYITGRRVIRTEQSSGTGNGAPGITEGEKAAKPDLKKVSSKMQMIQSIIDQVFLYDEDATEVEDYIYRGMMAGLNDPYSVYYNANDYKALQDSTNGSYSGIGAMISQNKNTGLCTIVKVFEGSPALEAGMKPGDIVYKVGDTLVAGESLDVLVSNYIKGKEGTQLQITVYRADSDNYVDMTLTRRKIEVPTVESRMLADNVGYVTVSEFDAITVEQFEKAIDELEKQGMEQLVIDLRSNPGGILDSAVAMVDYILPDDMKNFEKGNGKTLIVYTADKNGDGDTYTASDGHEVDMPIAILVNENSASASEVFTGALKDYKKAVVVGTTSYGKGIVQNLIPLGDGSAIKITTAHYYTPSGFDLHGKGIAPDVEVELDENLKSQAVVTPEEDNQVQAAVKALEKK
ncbi:MAG: S41 family peptidase [Enterocloster sp.]|nr:S41 family peptidase [Enterocloster sp.]